MPNSVSVAKNYRLQSEFFADIVISFSEPVNICNLHEIVSSLVFATESGGKLEY